MTTHHEKLPETSDEHVSAASLASPGAFPSSSKFSIERHGNGWAIYRGRDQFHHGLNLGQLTETDQATAAMLEAALNAADAQNGADVTLTASGPDSIDAQAPTWRCFHCDEYFTTSESAQEHFGAGLASEPACQIDISEYRAMEARMRRYNEEDSDMHRQIHRMESAHQAALLREEEKGYAKGLKDAVATLPNTTTPILCIAPDVLESCQNKLHEGKANTGTEYPELGEAAVLPENPEYTGQKFWKLHRCADDHQCRAEIGGGCAEGFCSHFGVEPDDDDVPRFPHPRPSWAAAPPSSQTLSSSAPGDGKSNE